MRRLSTIAHLAHAGLLGTALVLGGVSPAQAGPKKPAKAAAGDKKAEAREAYKAGEKAYQAGDYTAAYEGFKKANDLIPSPIAQFWMAMSKSYGSDVPASIEALETVLMSPDAEKLGEEKLNMASARMKELKGTPATIQVTSDPAGAEVSIDGKPQSGVTPLTLSVPPGTHSISVALKGFETYKADFTAKPAQKLDQAATLEKSKASAAPAVAQAPKPAPAKKEEQPGALAPAAEEGKKNNLPAFIAIGVGVVGAGVGTFFGIKALSAKSDFNDNPTTDNADRTERNALIADMSFGIALTLGITGAVLLLTGNDSSEVSAQAHATPRHQKAHLQVAPILTSTTQGAAARLTF